MIFKFSLYLFVHLQFLISIKCSKEEETLIKHLFNGYNKLIRPVRNSSDHVVIKMDLVLLQLINVYEKEQIMKTNVWVNLKWLDYQLLWSESDHIVKSVRVPFDKVWTPDIVLFNNADGNYEASYKSNAVLYSSIDNDGNNILLVPPAIYKSSCTIDVSWFPFDEQLCDMRFGSWTFDATQVKLVLEKPTANLDDYLPSGTWDIIEAPCETNSYVQDGIERMELIYKFRIRRKTLFYTVNLIIPTVLISFLSIFVFYLPTDEGEKMTLCISILLALVVFLLLVSKILPPTSDVIPLIAKYLLFTFIMNIVTILNTVVIINWNYRTPRTHNMPRWVRCLFIEFLPKILLMRRPCPDVKTISSSHCDLQLRLTQNSPIISSCERVPIARRPQLQHQYLNNYSIKKTNGGITIKNRHLHSNDFEKKSDFSRSHHQDDDFSPEILEAADKVVYITNHIKSENNNQEIRNDWKYVALVIDRIQLILFFSITLIGTCAILLKAPYIFEYVDQQEILKRISAANKL